MHEPSKAPCAVFIPAVKNISDGLAFDHRVPTGLQRERRGINNCDPSEEKLQEEEK